MSFSHIAITAYYSLSLLAHLILEHLLFIFNYATGLVHHPDDLVWELALNWIVDDVRCLFGWSSLPDQPFQ